MDAKVTPAGCLRGTTTVPGDKSISHRAVMLAAVAEGVTRIRGFLRGADCLSTLQCMRALGAEITDDGEIITVIGQGLPGLHEPDNVLDVGNSGTTIRLLLGLLTGQDFYACLTGDASIRRRPMGRVIKPLTAMGARIWGRKDNTLAPVTIRGTSRVTPQQHILPVASAQVKSAILLAGLYADGVTAVTEPAVSRDHTERMLRAFGVNVTTQGNTVKITGKAKLTAQKEIVVPGDISSAAFFLVAASILPQSDVTITGVGINPTRTGVIDVLQAMGADIRLQNVREQGGEPVADIRVRGSALRGVIIGGDMIPRLIDEIPVLAVAAAVAEGITVISGAGELRVKETDRIRAIATELGKLGAGVTETPDGLIIAGGAKFQGAKLTSYGDHRIAMAMAVAGLAAREETEISGADCMAVSFPGFLDHLNSLRDL